MARSFQSVLCGSLVHAVESRKTRSVDFSLYNRVKPGGRTLQWNSDTHTKWGCGNRVTVPRALTPSGDYHSVVADHPLLSRVRDFTKPGLRIQELGLQAAVPLLP